MIFSAKQKPTQFFDQQIRAAKLMTECISVLREAEFDSAALIFDPNRTNLIGREFSPITTTLGDLTAKRTATNPNFAALLVRWFHELNLSPGDVVAIGSSGSFPSLTLSTLCAAEAMDLQPILIVSLGASTFGANRPDFTYLDMENFLYEKGVLRHKTIAASLGGSDDLGGGLSEEGISSLRQAAARNHIPFLKSENLSQNVRQRAELYFSKGIPSVFVNIGGARINIGNYETAIRLKPGINEIFWKIEQPESMVEFFAAKKIPIIHLLNIKKIALKYNLPIDPIPLPVLGESGIYFRQGRSLSIVAFVVLLVFSAWILIIRKSVF